MKKYDAARTKTALLEAGLRVFEKKGLAEMRVDDVVAEAGVAKGTFYLYFKDRAAYLLGLHRDFHDALRVEILEKAAQLPHGRERLLLGTTVYLDGCLKKSGVKAMLFEARSEPALRDEVFARNENFAAVVAEDFKAMGWKNPAAAAKLFVAMAAEAALSEMQAGKKLAPLRAALGDFLTPPGR